MGMPATRWLTIRWRTVTSAAAKGGLGIALGALPEIGDVVGNLVVELGCAGQDRRLQIGDGGEWLVVHVDQVKGVLRDIGIVCDHRGDRLADVPDPVVGQHGGGDGQHPVRAGALAAVGQRLLEGGAQLLAGEHGDHAGQGGGRCSVDAQDAGVAVDAAQDRQVADISRTQVVHVGGATGDQPGVLFALDAGAHLLHVDHGGGVPFQRCARGFPVRCTLQPLLVTAYQCGPGARTGCAATRGWRRDRGRSCRWGRPSGVWPARSASRRLAPQRAVLPAHPSRCAPSLDRRR